MKGRIRTFAGQKDISVTEREIRNRELSKKAACDGMVLLENNGVLPLAPGSAVFLAGNGVVNPIKGGTGSGDVNVRRIIRISLSAEP